MQIFKVLESGDVERFHAVPGVTKQTVSSHSWGVALLCQQIWPNCSKNLLLVALTHDCSELITGDIPATFKWEYPEIKKELESIENKTKLHMHIDFCLTPEEHETLKICDILEGMNYCLDRFLAGETKAGYVFEKWSGYLKSEFNLNTEATFIFNELMDEYNANR